jgi:hypothetical protein
MPETKKKSVKKVYRKATSRVADPLTNPEYRLIHTQDFKLAFEVEFVYDATKLTLRKIQDRMRRLKRGTQVGRDGSIRCAHKFEREDSAEIKTPPLYPIEALQLLKRIFEFVDKNGYTNESCGLHLNFSPCANDLYYSLNPFSFTSEGIWDEITKEFRREDNTYCRKVWPAKPKNLVEIWNRVLYVHDIRSEHYNVVNMSHYGANRVPTSRIEIRGFGNREYHKKFPRIVFYSEQIFHTFMRNCVPPAPAPVNGVSSGTASTVPATPAAVQSSTPVLVV